MLAALGWQMAALAESLLKSRSLSACQRPSLVT